MAALDRPELPSSPPLPDLDVRRAPREVEVPRVEPEYLRSPETGPGSELEHQPVVGMDNRKEGVQLCP
jgi:hypothetical protein